MVYNNIHFLIFQKPLANFLYDDSIGHFNEVDTFDILTLNWENIYLFWGIKIYHFSYIFVCTTSHLLGKNLFEFDMMMIKNLGYVTMLSNFQNIWICNIVNLSLIKMCVQIKISDSSRKICLVWVDENLWPRDFTCFMSFSKF